MNKLSKKQPFMPKPLLAKQAFILVLAVMLLSELGRGIVSGNYPGQPSQASPLVAPDFAISASPDSLTIPLGTTATSIIALVSLGGFSGIIFLSASSHPLDVSLNTTEVTLTGGGTDFATLSILAPTSAAPGNYAVGVGGSSGCSLSHNAQVTVTVTGADFSVSAQKSLLAIPPGGSDTSTIDLVSMNGFSGLVTLYSDSPPLTSTLGPSSLTLNPGGSGTSTLTVSIPGRTHPGNYTVEVTGITSSLLHIIDITVTVTGPGFTLSAEPFSLTVDVAGAVSNSSIITVIPFGGFVGSGSFTSSFDTSEFTLSLSTTSFTIPESPTSTLTLTVLANTPPGLYFVTVNGTSGSISQPVDIPVTVRGPDFEVSANPPSLTVAASGPSCPSAISLAAIEGFTGTVALSLFPSGLSITLSPTSMTGSETSTLTVSAPGGTLPGFYFVTIEGDNGPLAHFLNLAVLVTGPDFTLSPDPDVLTINPGLSGTSTIHALSVSNFAGTISLLATASVTDITTSLNTTSLHSGSGSATLTVNVGQSVAPGSYTVVVTGVSGQLIHSEFVSIEVTGPDFSISSDSYTLTISTTSPGTSTIAVVPLNGFTGQVSLSAVASFDLNASIGPAIISNSETATLSVNSTVPGSYTAIVSGSSGLLFHSVVISVTVLGTDFLITAPTGVTVPVEVPGSLLITVTSSGGFADNVTLASTVSPTGLSCSLTPNFLSGGSGTSNLSCSGSNGTYSVTVTGTSGSAGPHSKTVTFTVADFAMSAAPVVPSRVLVDSSGTSTVTITATAGFAGVVDLSVSQSSGLSCTLPASVTLSSPTKTATLSCIGSTAGDYAVTVTGTGGSPSTATLYVLYHISDFTLAIIPSRLSVNVGGTGSSAMSLTSVNGFSDPVGLSYSVSPSTGLVCSLIPSRLAGSGSSSLSCTSSASGTFTVTVTGTSGSLSHSATSTVTSPPPNFSLTSTPTSVTIQAEGSGSTVITVTSAYGFSDAVDLSATVSPSGPTLSVGTLVTGGSGTSSLTINVGSGVVAGTYIVTVQGTSGGLSHYAQVTVTVTSTPLSGTSDILGLSPTIFYPFVAGVAVSLAVVALYFVRVRRRSL